VIKAPLIRQIKNQIEFVIKKANSYLCTKTDKLRFLDFKNYLAPGFSHSKFLKAYGSEEGKFYFPYEIVDSLEKLDYGRVPDHSAFHSSLTNTNTTLEQYQLVQRTWEERECKTLRDLLIYYNNLDVSPFVQAVKTLLAPYPVA